MHDSLQLSPFPLSNHVDYSSDLPKARGQIGIAEHAALLEEAYEQWRVSPESLDPTWRSFFEGFELGCQISANHTNGVSPVRETSMAGAPDVAGLPHRLKQARIYNLLFAYRTLGHHIADLDPLQIVKPVVPELDISHFKFSEEDLDTVFDSGTLAGGGDRTLREIVEILRETYCGRVAVEYMHIQNFPIRRWLRDRMEKSRNKPSFSREKKKRILTRVLAAERFERFLHTRYVGQKRFSLEGGETLIPVLDSLIESCPSHGVQQIVMGMAHRGRLNVLANILGKNYKTLFSEFHENFVPETVQGDGDVKYHVGFEAKITTVSGHQVGISLAPNPSHLEAVDPVVQGKARAWQRLLGDSEHRLKVIPLLIHGDAAFIGQGIVAETFNLSQLEGYKTGGTIHVVVNNQIGFTTLPQDARSSIYCTAIAKMVGAPIFHVNGDDPESAVFVMEMALDFRQRFQRDIVIDIVCYRRHGHNEGDEPNFTQPTLYNAIDHHPHISDQYIERLVAGGDLASEEAEQFKQQFDESLNQALVHAKEAAANFRPAIRKPLATPELLDPIDTRVAPETLRRIGLALTDEPEGFQINAKIKRLIAQRRAMVEGKEPVDWGCAEALAFASLLNEKIPIRLSGQDSRRGTFSHRHAVYYDVTTRERYFPLKHISPDQATFCVYNSPLSEAAVLGFDFGYSLDYRNILILWEAQFGDFANGAQTIIDQYITSSESKWGVTSNIVLLLPHGYHGQGPEHSSARMERFLQACAEDNIVVANCTTPTNFFHLLRRQALRPIKKPLIVFTPKGLLRDKRCTSSIDELAHGSFEEILPDPVKPSEATRLILCQGKVYYDLVEYREKHGITDTAIVRIEQLYPLHTPKLEAVKAAHPQAKHLIWCQEESQNMGAWFFMEPRLRSLWGRDFIYAGRDASSSPATGSLAIHLLEQEDLVQQAFQL
ncbi:MAG: 2-oxoglutarate dehydrogenase E1 component [Candidatus Methylacidiphilales bacterium]